ncbi:prenyltransferase/squalene oxidase repeat-containing protein [Streptomyces sp. NPDC058373]|uniref:prenyltransferase/squalene oxidase repeat-containing protein n=1 Tax=Streptomyces sp. NPDC058373 TaxID=3346465 RepID=UPI003649572F
MTVRRSALALTALTALTAASAAFAPAAVAEDSPAPSPSVRVPSGLYGDGDPTYDGVYRQSLALLAQDTAGVEPAAKAVDWLMGQQCEDGSFAPFRADPSAACDAKTPVDTNQTATAVQALAALGGHDKAVGKAVDWLKSVQNDDGGWSYTPGDDTDTNSTSLVVGALAATGTKAASVTSGKDRTPEDALLGLSLECAGGGAFAFQPEKNGDLNANADATAAGVLGGLGSSLVVTKGKTGAQPACEKPADARTAAANGAAHLAGLLEKDGHLTSTTPGAEDQPDIGNTADAVTALYAAGLTDAAKKPLAWLKKNGPAWAKQSGPSAYAQLVLTAHATGTDPRAFGSTDLVAALNATGPEPEADGKGGSDAQGGEEQAADEDGSQLSVWWIIGVGLLVGAGVGLMLSLRNKSGRK